MPPEFFMLLRVLTYSSVLFLIVFSIGSAFAADDHVPAVWDANSNGVCIFDTWVQGSPTAKNISECVDFALSYPSLVSAINHGASIETTTESPTRAVIRVGYYGTGIININFQAKGAYVCSSPDYPVGPMDLNGQQVCYKRTCSSTNNWFSSMDLGTGSACSFGCKYTVTSSFQSSVGPNAFVANGNAETCSCPAGSTQCWLDRTPNTEGDNDDTGTCYAWDLGHVKGVDCGKNGEMTVDLQPINDSLVAMSQTNAAQDKQKNM